MKQVVDISFRNLVRQKRRNLLLGIAIAFGAMVLILANAFSHGISRVLFEQVVRYTNGHVAISYMRNGNMMSQVFHDDERIRSVIKNNAPEAIRTEEGVGVFGRAIGNGVADNVIMVGVDLNGTLTEAEKKEYQANFKMLHGSFMSLNDKSAGIPVVLAEQKAKYLRVAMGDALRVRFTDINNQSSSARLIIVGIFKPANVFMAAPIFLELQDARRLAGYGPHDIATVQLTLKDPQRTAQKVADRLHKALKPGLAVITGRVQSNKLNLKIDCVTLGFRTDSASLRLMSGSLRLARGDSARSFGYEGVVLSSRLATVLNIGPGDTVRVFWKARYDTVSGAAKFAVTGVADSAAPVPAISLLVNERDFYHAYYDPLPPVLPPGIMRRMPDSANPLWPALAPEYLLMKRCATTDEYAKVSAGDGTGEVQGHHDERAVDV